MQGNWSHPLFLLHAVPPDLQKNLSIALMNTKLKINGNIKSCNPFPLQVHFDMKSGLCAFYKPDDRTLLISIKSIVHDIIFLYRINEIVFCPVHEQTYPIRRILT